MKRKSARRSALLAAPLVALLGVAACGGGGGRPPAPDALQVLLRDGDTLPGGFEIATIESANMAADRSVAVIASGPGVPAENGVFLLEPGGRVRTIMAPSTPPEGLTLTTVRNMAMAQTGEVVFEVGDELDFDGVFFYGGGELRTVARTEPGTTPPGFRILGELRLAEGGLVAFTDGTSPCTVDSSSGRERITCNLRIHVGPPGASEEVAVPNDLSDQSPSNIILQVNRRQQIAVGLPARGSDPLVGVIEGGVFEGLLNRRQEFPGLGTLFSARPRSLGTNGDLVIDAAFDTDGDGKRDQTRVVLLSNGAITSIAETGVEADLHPKDVVLDVRGLNVDDSGRVLYQIEFGREGEASGSLSLRVWEGGQSREIAFEGLRFGRNAQDLQLRILSIEQIRANRSGDVVLRALIGRFNDGTRRIDRTAILRWTGTELEELLATKSDLPEGGRITSLSIQDLNESGDLLLIGSIDRRANRALFLLPGG